MQTLTRLTVRVWDLESQPLFKAHTTHFVSLLFLHSLFSLYPLSSLFLFLEFEIQSRWCSQELVWRHPPWPNNSTNNTSNRSNRTWWCSLSLRPNPSLSTHRCGPHRPSLRRSRCLLRNRFSRPAPMKSVPSGSAICNTGWTKTISTPVSLTPARYI